MNLANEEDLISEEEFDEVSEGGSSGIISEMESDGENNYVS